MALHTDKKMNIWKDITLLNTYVPNIESDKYIR